MTTYQIRLQHTTTWTFVIEAASEEDAFQQAEDVVCDAEDANVDYEQWNTRVFDASGNELDYAHRTQPPF